MSKGHSCSLQSLESLVTDFTRTPEKNGCGEQPLRGLSHTVSINLQVSVSVCFLRFGELSFPSSLQAMVLPPPMGWFIQPGVGEAKVLSLRPLHFWILPISRPPTLLLPWPFSSSRFTNASSASVARQGVADLPLPPEATPLCWGRKEKVFGCGFQFSWQSTFKVQTVRQDLEFCWDTGWLQVTTHCIVQSKSIQI